jgi:hypothetical protein
LPATMCALALTGLAVLWRPCAAIRSTRWQLPVSGSLLFALTHF